MALHNAHYRSREQRSHLRLYHFSNQIRIIIEFDYSIIEQKSNKICDIDDAKVTLLPLYIAKNSVTFLKHTV